MSRWILLRDILLTLAMWFLFILLAMGEVDRVAGHWFAGIGLRSYFQRAGFNQIADNWSYFLYALAPYLGMALLLAISLVSFAIDTINRRLRAMRGREPPKLALTVEARHAELATMTPTIGEATQASRAELTEVQTVDARTLLMILGKLDEAALLDARQLKVTQVHITGDGHYQIVPE